MSSRSLTWITPLIAKRLVLSQLDMSKFVMNLANTKPDEKLSSRELFPLTLYSLHVWQKYSDLLSSSRSLKLVCRKKKLLLRTLFLCSLHINLRCLLWKILIVVLLFLLSSTWMTSSLQKISIVSLLSMRSLFALGSSITPSSMFVCAP